MYGAQKCFDKFISLSVSYMPPQKHYCLLSLIWLNAILIILEVFLKFIWKLWCKLKKKKDEKNQLQKKSCYSGGSAVMAQKQMKRLAVSSYTHTHTSNKMCKVYYIYTDATHTQLGLQRENWWKLYIRSHLTHLSLKSQWQC